MPDAPVQIIANGSGSTPAAPVQITGNGSGSAPAAPVQITGNGAGSSPAAPPDPSVIAASYAPRAILVTGALVPAATGVLVLAGEHNGRPCYVTGGTPNLQAEAADPDGPLPEEGRWVVVYWSDVDSAWAMEVWVDGGVDGALLGTGAWVAESEVISPDFATGWAAMGSFTGTPVVSRNLAPAQITGNGSASTPAAPPVVA